MSDERSGFRLAVCAEMVFTELAFVERVRRIDALGFDVEIWDFTNKDLPALAATGATFRSMTGYTSGNLLDGTGTGRYPGSPYTALVGQGKAPARRPLAVKPAVSKLSVYGTDCARATQGTRSAPAIERIAPALRRNRL